MKEYEKIINKVDQIIITNRSNDKTVELSNEQTEIFKDILQRNIEVDYQREFRSDFQIDLYSKNNRIGFLMIAYNQENGFVNFNSDELNFGYELTYGIGRYLDETNMK